MPNRLNGTFVCFSVALAASWCACSTQQRPSQAPSETGTDAAPAQASVQANPEADLHWFGHGETGLSVDFAAKATTTLQQHTEASEGADFDPDVDPTGKKLVFASTRHSPNSHLYIKPIGGATLTQITDGPMNDAQPSFSPDGKRVAFTSDRAGHWDIWIVDVDGRNPMQITNHVMAELHPSWSPDSKQVVYSRVNVQENKGELWIVELDNPGVKHMIGEGLFPAWSPRGGKIAYQRARARGSRWFSIWTLEIKNAEARFPTEVAWSTEAAFISPEWSPDGSRITFASLKPPSDASMMGNESDSGASSRSDISIVDGDGRGRQQLTDGYGENHSPTWAADGRIYFTAKVDQTETIWSVKPFRPAEAESPPAVAQDRRAAQVIQTELDETVEAP